MKNFYKLFFVIFLFLNSHSLYSQWFISNIGYQGSAFEINYLNRNTILATQRETYVIPPGKFYGDKLRLIRSTDNGDTWTERLLYDNGAAGLPTFSNFSFLNDSLGIIIMYAKTLTAQQEIQLKQLCSDYFGVSL